MTIIYKLDTSIEHRTREKNYARRADVVGNAQFINQRGDHSRDPVPVNLIVISHIF